MFNTFCDRFDCVYPTRTARFGVALVRNGSLRLRSKEYSSDGMSLDGADTSLTTSFTTPNGDSTQAPCVCLTCQKYSRAYIHTLLRDHNTESLAAQLITCHNISYMMGLMRSMKSAIEAGKDAFSNYINNFLRLQFPNPVDVPAWAVEALEEGAGIKVIHKPCAPST